MRLVLLHMFRHIFRTSGLMDIPYMLNRPADCVYQRRASSDIIFFVSHRLDVGEFNSVVNDLADIVEENGGDVALAVLFSLLFDY